jgi:uncharacterized protein
MNIPSPCNNVCVLDPESGLCRGCKRTISEIVAWAAASDDEKRRILAELPARPSPASEAKPR